ncbi:MAG: hypothetical protein HY531_00215 [Chloroflexi bacterium]|nr:hypothetical protein [Chloroflexota bacterium]
MKSGKLILILVVIGLFAIACGPAAQPTPTPAPAVQPTATAAPAAQPTPTPALAGPKKGGTLKVWQQEPGEMDAAKTCSVATMGIAWQIWDNLFSVDSKNNVHPQMAGDWSLSPDGRLLEVSLRDGLRWHDGKAVTSDDVVASLNRWMGLDGIGKLVAERKDTVEAVDSDTVRIKLKESLGPMLYGLGKPGCAIAQIAPKWVVDKYPATARIELDGVVGSGAYKFKEWVPTSHLALERFEGYKPRSESPDGWSGAHIAYADKIEFRFIPQVATGIAALKAGQIDFGTISALDEVTQIQKDPDRFKVYISRPGGLSDIMVNMHPTALLGKNPRGDKLRKAIWIAQDPKEMMASLGPSQFYSVHGKIFFENTIWSSDAAKDLWEYHNLEAGKKLVAEAGYSGERIRCSYTVGSGSQMGWCLTMTDLLKNRMGMNAVAEPAEQAQHLPIRLAPDRAELLATGFNYLTSGYPLNNLGIAQKFYHWENEQMVKLFSEFASAVSYEAQKAIADKMQLLALQELPMYYWGETASVRVSREWVNGYLNTPVIPVFWNIWLSR